MPHPVPLEIRLFASYARQDRDLVLRLMDLLAPLFKTLKGFRVEPWIDHRIEPGEPWDPAIQTALAAADLGLALLSPAFLASAYIARVETPTFVALGPARTGTDGPPVRIIRPILPVLLKDLPPASVTEYRGYEHLQVFKDQARRSFARTRGHTADAFAVELANSLHGKLRRLYPAVAA